MLNRSKAASLSVVAFSLVAGAANAHVGVSGPGYAGQSQVLDFGVGHGCAGDDTVSVEVAIPEGVTSVRAMPNAFGSVEVNMDQTGVVTSVVWTKTTPHEADELYYSLSIRAELPDTPFETLMFPATQICESATGEQTTVEWNAEPGSDGDPVPTLMVLPALSRGWNRFEAGATLDDLSVFDHAEIVWVGDAAYSSNATTMELIEGEEDVTVLSAIAEGDEVWVKL